MNDVHSNPATELRLTDGAMDTLGCVFQTMSRESFPLDTDFDPEVFPAQCLEIARHIENGAAAPSFGIDLVSDAREWSLIRRFFVERRRNEKEFVTSRLGDYRGMVEHFIIGLRNICTQSDLTEQRVSAGLASIESAASCGNLDDVRQALVDAVKDVGQAFSEQRTQYEKQISSLNERVESLREDLVTAREEMQLDSLTNLCNRGAFDAALKRHVNTRFILNKPVCVVMIDVDNFKSVNDVLGHLAGDEVLQAIAGCLSRCFVRKNDMVARYGGDEFAVILPDTDLNESVASISRMLKSVRALEFDVSCSAGCTEIQDDETVESILARADGALYEAKEAGRDCFRTA